jgi:hypothetical protein
VSMSSDVSYVALAWSKAMHPTGISICLLTLVVNAFAILDLETHRYVYVDDFWSLKAEHSAETTKALCPQSQLQSSLTTRQ